MIYNTRYHDTLTRDPAGLPLSASELATSSTMSSTTITTELTPGTQLNFSSRTTSGPVCSYNPLVDLTPMSALLCQGTTKPLYATDEGFAVAVGNDFGGAENTAPVGTFTTAPYPYTLIPTDGVRAAVVGTAGATISF